MIVIYKYLTRNCKIFLNLYTRSIFISLKMNLNDIIYKESLIENTSSSYEPQLNAYIVCEKCEICNHYIYSKEHKCIEKCFNTNKFMIRKYYPNKVNAIDRYIQEEIIWLVIVDFSKYFEYCICDKYYNNATGKFLCIMHII